LDITFLKFILFLGIFSESTACGLQIYGRNFPAFLETSCYISFISNIWKIMSVKTPIKDTSTDITAATALILY